MIEFKLKPTFATVDSCFDLVGSHKLHPGPEWFIFHNLTREFIDDFIDIKFVSKIVLKFVGVSSKHLRVFLESLRQSSGIFGNFRKMFGSVLLAFGTILENLRKFSEGGRKSSENHQNAVISMSI